MLKTLRAQIGEFARDSILTPLCMIGEVIMEMIIPLMMASIIDDGEMCIRDRIPPHIVTSKLTVISTFL